METKRKALGKGLEQLFNSENINFEDVEKEIVANAAESDIIEIPIDEIRSNPFQPRKVFDQDKLQELSDSIKEHGLFQPIIVKKSIKGYELVAGERRTKAAKMAGFDKDIDNMPMGMHTLISEGSGGISGGQKQRLMIARAIINKPKILFFDEATSALDNITQKIVSDNIDSLNCTRVVIAHRLSTIKNCDRIIVLDKGNIKEEGTYDSLMKEKGYFYDLAIRQVL